MHSIQWLKFLVKLSYVFVSLQGWRTSISDFCKGFLISNFFLFVKLSKYRRVSIINIACKICTQKNNHFQLIKHSVNILCKKRIDFAVKPSVTLVVQNTVSLYNLEDKQKPRNKLSMYPINIHIGEPKRAFI